MEGGPDVSSEGGIAGICKPISSLVDGMRVMRLEGALGRVAIKILSASDCRQWLEVCTQWVLLFESVMVDST